MKKTPVVLIIYNRPDTTARVFNEIRRYKPTILYVIADGHKAGDVFDKNMVDNTRELIKNVDWDCDVRLNYADTNLGCRIRICTGLDWVFNQSEKAIILEDDCLPHKDFFAFCDEILNRYQYEPRIMHVSGSNYLFGKIDIEYSYYFSIYNHCSGWATWSRAWKYFDPEIKSWPYLKETDFLSNLFDNDKSRTYWESAFQDVYEKRIDSWAYCWTLACWMNNGLTIIPRHNLITNIGYGLNATHTKNARSRFADIPTSPLSFPLIHPVQIDRNNDADKITEKINYNRHFIRRVIGALLKTSFAKHLINYLK
ncbi:MAG: glycosyltransferase family 2 protein [Blastocatellales bacterium]